jgi:hypothetical protein
MHTSRRLDVPILYRRFVDFLQDLVKYPLDRWRDVYACGTDCHRMQHLPCRRHRPPSEAGTHTQAYYAKATSTETRVTRAWITLPT